MFGGACTSDKIDYPQDAFDKMYVIYNPADKALFAGSLLPGHVFGKLGYHGYRGPKNTKIKNIQGFMNQT